MKNFLYTVVAIIFTYLSFAFIKNDINYQNWSEELRIGYLLLSFFVVILGLTFRSEQNL